MSSQLVKVRPIHHLEGDSYEYRHGEIHIDEIEEDSIDVDGVSVRKTGDSIVWQYKDKPEIHIRRSGVYVEPGVPRWKAERQAYFALSILSEGPEVYVDKFHRV